MKPKANHKNWILIVVLIAVLVGYVAVFFIPTRHNIDKLRKDLVAKQNFVTLSGQSAAQLREVEEQLTNTMAYNRTWTKHAPQTGEISILLGKIHALARSANVQIDSFDPEPAETYDRLRQLPIAMVCSGKLPAVFNFLSDLEQMPQIIWLKSVSIERADKNLPQLNGRAGKARGFAQCELDMAIFMDNLKISN